MKAPDGEKIGAGLGFLFGIFAMKESYVLELGVLHRPGPGFYPFLGGFFLSLFSAIFLMKAILAPGEAAASGEKEGGKTIFAAYAFLGVLVYALILEPIGFPVATILFVIYFLMIFEDQKWWVMLVTAGMISVVCYVLFTYFLKSDLPLGVLDYLF